MTESTDRNRERILEAIDQLRKRKARPDIQRICNYLFRRFSVNSIEAKNDLQWCVDNNIVLRVEYKGSISYRNAAKKLAAQQSKRDSHGSAAVHDGHRTANSRKFAQLLTNSFGELIVQEPDYLEFGIPAFEIIKNILSKDSVRYTKKYISILLEKEVENGGLVRMENGNFLVGPMKNDNVRSKLGVSTGWEADVSNGFNTTVDDLSDDTQLHIESGPPLLQPNFNFKPKKKPMLPKLFKSTETPRENQEKQENVDSDDRKSDFDTLRVGGRRKKAKKVFDPSDNNVPKKRGRPAGSLNKATIEKQQSGSDSRPESRTSLNGRDQGGVCSVCHNQSKKASNDKIIGCRECSNKAHISCLNGDDMLLRISPDNTWQCPHCKTCIVCDETVNAGSLTVCAVCADAYHSSCHQPRIDKEKIRSGSKWLCINCQKPDELIINDIQNYSQKSSLNDENSSDSNDSNTSNYRSLNTSPTPPRLSPQIRDSPMHNGNISDSDEKDSDSEDIDPSIPDATHWTFQEVYQYFAQYFPEEAKIFLEQEIDGRSLLLLKRMDVLTNLNLKLGPALKIYRHVVMLQVRRDDPKLYWL